MSLPKNFSKKLVAIVCWHYCIVHTTALRILNGSLASSQEFYAVPWSTHIGNFTSDDCASVVAPLVYVQLDEIICEPLNRTKYEGRIAFIQEFYGSQNPNFQGCPHETRYHNFVNAGAVGIVSWYEGNPGKYREVFSAGYEPNMGKVPLLSVGFDFSQIANNIIANPNIKLTVQLSCVEDDHWEFWNNMRLVHFTILGTITLAWGIRGIYMARKMRRTSRKASVAMPAVVLVIEGLILCVVGITMVLGIVGDSTPALFGYGIISAQVRNFMYFGYTGASFWTSILVAMYWQELRQALSSLEIHRQIRNVFTTRKGAIIVGVTFVLFALSEIVAVYLLAFLYVRIPGPAVSGIFSVLNTVASIFFIYQALSLRKFLKESASHFVESDGMKGETLKLDSHEKHARRGMKRNAERLAFWMQIYAASNLLQIALAVPMISLINTTTGPGSAAFLLLVTLTRNAASIAKIEGLIPTKLGKPGGFQTKYPEPEPKHSHLVTSDLVETIPEDVDE